jgi:hypothetical protein
VSKRPWKYGSPLLVELSLSGLATRSVLRGGCGCEEGFKRWWYSVKYIVKVRGY